MAENIDVFAIEHYIRFLNVSLHKLGQAIGVSKKEQPIIRNVCARVIIIKLVQAQIKKVREWGVPIMVLPNIQLVNVRLGTI